MDKKLSFVFGLTVLLAACDNGVQLGDQSSINAQAGIADTLMSSEPLTIDDTQAREFFEVGVNTTAQLTIAHVDCPSDTDTITPDQMSYTNGFVREEATGNSTDSVRARNVVEEYGAQYIEVCVDTEIDRDYFIETRVSGPSVNEDSFFFTVGDGAPVIYDIKRRDFFSNDLVRSRDTDPLRVALTAGRNILRFHYRERNTAISQISFLRLPNENTTTELTPENSEFSAELLTCAESTGLEPERINSLIEQHLPTDDYLFTPLVNQRDDGVNIYFAIDGDFDTARVFCLRDFGPIPTSDGLIESVNEVTTTLAPTLILGSSGTDLVDSPLTDNVTFYGFAGDDSVIWQVGGQFFGGSDNDVVQGLTAGLFDGETGDNTVQVATAEAEIINSTALNFATTPTPLSELSIDGLENDESFVRWPEDVAAHLTIEITNNFTILSTDTRERENVLGVNTNRLGSIVVDSGETADIYARSVLEVEAAGASLLSREATNLSFTKP